MRKHKANLILDREKSRANKLQSRNNFRFICLHNVNIKCNNNLTLFTEIVSIFY